MKARCNLGKLYYLNKYIFIALVVSTIAHCFWGNIQILAPIFKVAFTILYTTITVFTFFVQPSESREFYINKAKMRGEKPSNLFIGFSIFILQLCAVVFLIMWYFMAWTH